MVMLHARVVKSAGNDGKTEAPGEKKMSAWLPTNKDMHLTNS